MMDTFAAAGGNFIDTAHIYSAWLPDGTGKSETTIGRWLKKSGLRSRIIVATKGGHYDLDTPTISRVTPECIDRDIVESLDRLQTDSIDLYFLHRDNAAVPVGELLDALQPHLRAGRLKAIGASNWWPERLLAAADYARTHSLTGFSCSQCSWSLAQTNPKQQGVLGMYYVGDEGLRFHRKTKFPLVAYSSQAQGFFAQSWSWPKLENPTEKQKSLRENYYSKHNVQRWKRAGILAKHHGCSVNALALAYATNQSFPTVALIGPSQQRDLECSLAAADLKLTAKEIAFLENGRSWIDATIAAVRGTRQTARA